MNWSYPLRWPATWPRVSTRGWPQFKQPSSRVVGNFVRDELIRLGATDATLSSNLKVRRADNEPLDDESLSVNADPGAAVYFTLRGKPHVLACDKWARVKHNIYAIGLHIESIRGQQRWGVGSIEQAFSGFLALPATADSTKSAFAELGLEQASATPASVESAFRSLLQKAHPDHGGSPAALTRLVQVRDACLHDMRMRGVSSPIALGSRSG